MSNLEHALEVAAAAHEGNSTRPAGRISSIAGASRKWSARWTKDRRLAARRGRKGVGWPLARLQTAGFSPTVVAAVDALAKKSGEGDPAFVRRAAVNPLARPVKKADLEDNLRQAREIAAPVERFSEGLRILGREFGI
jgi:hypothetical protein